ncbi:sigma-70 family RNA polymerase sigma factor [Persicimonas caeni]|uniref:Sigma-70 family RNA polymerase sigma factor n=1 Tax=Persicimonas caeni TaxID=2292766 RepID=A0A4Y6PTP1_PERCE|nr:sigma-70 family RNA polymerase sigma factor [Persicimonas caeni]QDG51668.1 sigma-70 family RNA polymerase sigma factor [Persicimonas caeni]QED32889.1 sigma-70 family RNA polymerase sigma factor [Persicimonas caeni]
MTTRDDTPRGPQGPENQPPANEASADDLPPERITQMTPEELVESYAGLVKNTGQELIQQLDCPVDLEDLIAWGYQGLLEAHQRFDPAMEVSFASFAFYRIRGAMYDGLRATGWGMRGTAIQLQDAIQLNDYMESNLLAQAKLPQTKSLASCIKYLDGMVGDCVTICLLQNTKLEQLSRSEAATQGNYVERRELIAALQAAIERLSDNERDVLVAYYIEDYSMTEIAEKLGISKSWVSRINARAVQKVRRIMFEDGDPWELYMIRE